MEITRPKKRDQRKWMKHLQEIRNFLQAKKEGKWTFEEYCEYSIMFLEADDSEFLNINNKKRLEHLTSPPLIFEGNNQTNKETRLDEEEQTHKIVRVITYAWSTIIGLIQGKQNNLSNPLGIYTDQNINLHFARLQQILKQLKGKRYRCALYIKQNSYAREIAEKEISQEIVFVKLLQNILRTQTKKIIDVRFKHNPPNKQQEDKPKEQPEDQSIEETLPNIRDVIKVKEYFSQKFAKPNPQAIAATTKDPIDLQNQQRRFNAAVIRFHMQDSQRR